MVTMILCLSRHLGQGFSKRKLTRSQRLDDWGWLVVSDSALHSGWSAERKQSASHSVRMIMQVSITRHSGDEEGVGEEKKHVSS